jgi:hypothetical protein
MNKQTKYVSPGIEVHRVIMETSIVQTLSLQTTGQIEDWVIESDPVGNTAEEGGNAYVPWTN